MSLTILPAIDLKGGRCVRLLQGRADQETVYSADPVSQALAWQEQGAEILHLVDLDGAFEGRPVHLEVIAKICAALRIPVELGGGLRTDEDLRRAVDAGVHRVILGTRALNDVQALRTLAEQFGERLAVGIDARNGRVQVRGWVETSETHAHELARQVADAGVRTIIYTETSRDGMLEGVHAEAMSAMCDAAPVDIIASGGVSTLVDIHTLRALQRPNLTGVIVGKALYEKRITLADCLAAARSF